jgi:hypothetical protein
MSETKCNCWRAHSVNYAKGEGAPQTIETLQAAWDRDQELLLEQKAEISRLKEKLNSARNKLAARGLSDE